MKSTASPYALAFALLMLASCNADPDKSGTSDSEAASAVPEDNNAADEMASRDPAAGGAAVTEASDLLARPVMQAQVVLERLGFGAGVIDGQPGLSFKNALMGFQESRDLPISGELDPATRAALAQWENVSATRVVTIPQSWGKAVFTAIPKGAAQQADLAHMGYESMVEKLAERFHTTPAILAELNSDGTPEKSGNQKATPRVTGGSPTIPQFTPGQKVRVPNIGADRIDESTVDNRDWLETLRSLGVGTDQPSVAQIVVDESEGWLKGYDAQERLVAMFTVTTGSENDPLPIGDWAVKGIAYNPPFAFDPELFWDVPDSVGKQRLAPGPNGPVGVVWIDLNKEHYGIHGTPAPDMIGQTQSHGCVRLTNWDAARLAQMVGGTTKVEFRR